MLIGRFSHRNHDGIGVFTNDQIYDITGQFETFSEALSNPERVTTKGVGKIDRAEIEYLPPTTDKSAVFCAALNYAAHAEESNTAVPERPFIFTKLPRSLVGHKEPISYHSTITNEIDYEAELAAVIGTPAWRVSPEDALDYVAGYTILNDTSARDLQLFLEVGEESHIDWFSGKAMQATTPVGPTVVIDEIDDPSDLSIVSRVNGEIMQNDTTANMIQSVPELVSFISERVRLEPGDIIATGTPEGVGTFQDIQLYPGDVVEIDIEDVGTLKNSVVEATE